MAKTALKKLLTAIAFVPLVTLSITPTPSTQAVGISYYYQLIEGYGGRIKQAETAAQKYDFDTAIILYRRVINAPKTRCGMLFSIAGLRAAQAGKSAYKFYASNDAYQTYFNTLISEVDAVHPRSCP